MHKIVVIEDNKEVRENICEILDLAGYETIAAENGKVGVKTVTQEKPDLVLCDVMMPELDGYGVLHILSKKSETAYIPFVFLTAKAEKEDFRKGMSLGADDYITKPFKELDLLNTIENRLKKIERLRKSGVGGADASLSSFFSQVNATKKLEALQEENEHKKLPAKQILYSEGTNAHNVYYVVSGKIKKYRSNDNGKEYITDIAVAGDFLGQFAILENRMHNESAISIEDSEVAIIPKDTFIKLLYSDRDVSNQFIKMLSSEVDEKAQQLINLAYNSVRKRVADALLLMMEKVNETKFHISREDLANLTGTSKETVIRTLSDFKQEKLIRIEQNEIQILDFTKLEEIIG